MKRYFRYEEIEHEYYDIIAVCYDDSEEVVDEGYRTEKEAEKRIAEFKADDAQYPNDKTLPKRYFIRARIEEEVEEVEYVSHGDYD